MFRQSPLAGRSGSRPHGPSGGGYGSRMAARDWRRRPRWCSRPEPAQASARVAQAAPAVHNAAYATQERATPARDRPRQTPRTPPRGQDAPGGVDQTLRGRPARKRTRWTCRPGATGAASATVTAAPAGAAGTDHPQTPGTGPERDRGASLPAAEVIRSEAAGADHPGAFADPERDPEAKPDSRGTSSCTGIESSPRSRAGRGGEAAPSGGASRRG